MRHRIGGVVATPPILFLCQGRGIGYYADKSASLNAFPYPLAAEALANYTSQGSYFVVIFCFLYFRLQASLRRGIKNKKMSSDIFLLRLFAEEEGFERRPTGVVTDRVPQSRICAVWKTTMEVTPIR